MRAAVAGDFQREHVNDFPMRPDKGSIDLGSIDARSSKPLVKEDDVDRDRRRESTEKSKSVKDMEKKKEKKKNLTRQALEKHRAKSRQRGEPEEESPDEDDGGDGDDDSDDSEGMASCLDRMLEGPPQIGVDVPRMGVPKGAPSGSRESQQRESSPRRSRADTPVEPALGRAVPHPQPPPASKAGHRVKSLATGPLTRGRTAASSKGEMDRGSASPGTGQAGDAESRPAPAREGPGASTRGGSRPAGRGTGRRVALPVGLLHSLAVDWCRGSPASSVGGGVHPAVAERKRGEEERERETLQHLQEGQQQPQQEGEEGEEGRRPEGAQLEELLEQDRQQELLELQEYQKQRSQQLEALLEPPPRSLAQPEPPTNKSLRSGRRVCLSMVRRP
ncbi:TRAF3-interacting protein 1-like [Sorghum bicolor]|uniref:TRAF3-interacting protein 1-like n=1 Tax=Sorghum bicolor TaxID=4558 RepID=UPI000B425037|nr:TRAF3-interacting protein 1-like [Sorghum bicolor]|eukprot:XP_021315156.1 TRAF3-interacting protein 1-like [Sorghum bicolor]